MTASAPLLALNNGVRMPAVGLGVFQTPPSDTTAAVATALTTGYRLIDTAASYGNEREVGEGIRRSGIDRDEVFIQTKVWISDYGHAETLHAFQKSAGKLGVEQIDLLLLHQPLTSAFEKTIAAYKALEQLLAEGKVRAIGVSNFIADRLAALLEQTDVVPAVNQIELHPYFSQPEARAADNVHRIVDQAWSPIGGITSYRGEHATSTFNDPVITEIGQRHSKTAAQVMLRWHLQRGRGTVPKSTRAERIKENFDVLDFELAEHELTAIDSLDKGVRGGPNPDEVTLEAYGREIPEA